MKSNCIIKGIGSFFPETILKNDDINNDGLWVKNNLGIKQRHIVKNELSSDLGYKSAKKALENSSLKIDEIDLIITCTSSPDRISPSTACIIQEKLKPNNPIPSFDLNAVCSGFVYAMEVATPMLEKYNNILLIFTETYSRWTDYNHRNSVFFGDGSASFILQKNASGWYYGDIYADGKGKENFTIKHGDTMFNMVGKEVYKTGTEVLPLAINKILNKLDLRIDQISYFVPHQPSYKILYETAKLIGLPKEKIKMNMDVRANTAGASIPTVLCDLINANILKDNDKILFAAVGSGWTWGAGVLSWKS
tara:strand:+ start:2178 stop:3098 length:921 start_codon:yes stop_codon:yes gene_type:complete